MRQTSTIPLRAALAAACLAVFLARPARADVELPAVFGSGMVLQQGTPVPVWGWADPGEEVRVSFAGQTQQTTADESGAWRVTLQPLAMQRKGSTLTVEGKDKIRLRDVLVGEVWLASGQSNMEFSLSRANPPPASWRAPPPDRLRLFHVPRDARAAPRADVKAEWTSGTDAKSRGRFSAVAWYFGAELARRLRCPVGLIESSWGGTHILPWTPDPKAPPPSRAVPAASTAATPAALYDGMIAPLVPFAIRGAIWYQGESDAARGRNYAEWFPAMIRAWREAWGEGDFPFYFVQLANFHPRLEEPGESFWAELREAQLLTLRGVEHTGMAVTIDIGDGADIHPRNKHEVGLRLARWALAGPYGKEVEPSGPLYTTHEVVEGRVVLHFDHVAGGLRTRDGSHLEGFAVAGPDRHFVWAKAEIEGDTVVVESPDVADPVAVRYAWADNPACNLVNDEGLPASPFRTDEWERAPGGR